MARTGAVGETSTINPSRTRFASQSQQAVAYLGRSHRMMNEIPTKTRTGERTEPFLMVGQKKSEGGFRFEQLAKFEAAREDESATQAGKARWKVFGSSRCVAMHNSGSRPRIYSMVAVGTAFSRLSGSRVRA